MNRETIEKAANERRPYTEEECGSSYMLGKNVGFKRGFMDGAQWRINSVWHETSELPSRSGYLAVLCHNGIMETIHHTIGIGFQEMQLKGYSKWAYVDDLLPDRKEVTE